MTKDMTNLRHKISILDQLFGQMTRHTINAENNTFLLIFQNPKVSQKLHNLNEIKDNFVYVFMKL